jgi:hypothetical protein
MAPQFDRRLRELLRECGCTFVRQGKDSHEIWHSPITKRNFPVPVGIQVSILTLCSCKSPRCVSRHTANAVLRQAGLPKALCPELFAALARFCHSMSRDRIERKETLCV